MEALEEEVVGEKDVGDHVESMVEEKVDMIVEEEAVDKEEEEREDQAVDRKEEEAEEYVMVYQVDFRFISNN